MATVRIQLRRGTSNQWDSANPTLAAGEIGIETDTNTFKFGDGVTAWNSLDYALSDTVDDFIPLSQKGEAGGVATLDGSGKVPYAQIPSIDELSQDAVNAALVAGTGLDKTYDDVNNLITIDIDSTVATLTGSQTLTNKTLTSPELTGTPTAPTAASNTNNTQIATTAFAKTVANTAQSNAESYTDGQITALISASPSTLNTLNELAEALGDDPNFATTVTNSLATKANASDVASTYAPLVSPVFSGNVGLPLTTSIGDVSATEIAYINGVTSSVQAQLDDKLASATAASTYAPIASPTLTGTVTLPASTSIGDVSNVEIAYINGVTSSVQAQLDDKLASATAASTYAPLVAPTFTGNVTLPASTSIGDVSNVEIAYINGVTSSVQAQLDDKLASATAASTYAPLVAPTFTGNVTLPASTSIGDVSNVEIAYINGVTSGVQTQLDAKAPLASPTFTGTVTLPDGTVTGAMIVDATIPTGKIADTAITAAKLGASAVETDKINDLAVTTGKIADSAVTSAKIADGTIVNADINASAEIDWTKLAISSTVSATELGYVDGVTSAIQSQIDSKLASSTADSTYAPLASPALTGAPTAPTAAAATNTTQIATTAFVKTAVDNVIASAPGALDTLNELAAALGNDANFSTTLTNNLAAKAPLASPTFTGTVTVSESGVAFTDGTQTKEGVPSRTPISTVTAAYNLSTGGLSLRDTLVECNSSSAFTITIPANSTTAYPIGTSIDLLQVGTGQITVAGAAGVTLNGTPGLKLRSQYSSATLFKRATDTWIIMGDLTA